MSSRFKPSTNFPPYMIIECELLNMNKIYDMAKNATMAPKSQF